jgi:C4-dicarboxylate transporter, DctM subunit
VEWALTALPLILLILGFPIFIILLISSAVVLMFFMNVPFTAVHQVMFGSVDKFALMAVPFFLFAGELMGAGTMAKRLVDWVLSLIGWVRGSLALTTVGTCTVFGAISGSSTATVAAIGRILYPPLLDGGYSRGFASGLMASAGSIAIIIPPSITMILYGASAEQSVALLFIAGILPGLVLAALFALYCYWHAAREGIQPTLRFSPKLIWTRTKAAVWALGTPVLVLGGIYGGIFSPTEAAGIACVYGILVTLFIYRDLTFRELWKVSVNSMYLTAQVFIIVAAAGVFSWLLTVSGIPAQTAELIRQFSDSQFTVLLIMNILLLVVGCFLDPGSAILVLTPLLVPICKAFGIDLIHFGIVMTVNLAIGMYTPPFGLNLFVMQAVFRTPLSEMYRGLVGFIIVSLVALAIVTYVPWLSLYLTTLM